MSKLTAAKVVAKLSSLGYDLITSQYKLEKAVESKELLNHRLSYHLKDTSHKTGQLTFIDGRTSFKNGLAIDISIVDSKDLDRPLKLNTDNKFIKLITVDYIAEEQKEKELEKQLIDNQIKQYENKIKESSLKEKKMTTSIDNLSKKIDDLNKVISQLKEDNANYFKRLHQFILVNEVVFISCIIFLVIFICLTH